MPLSKACTATIGAAEAAVLPSVKPPITVAAARAIMLIRNMG